MRRKQEELSPSPQRKPGFPLSEILPVSPRFAWPSHALAQSGLPRYVLTPPGLPPGTAALRLPCGALLGPQPTATERGRRALLPPALPGRGTEGSSEAAAAGSGEVAPRQGQVTTRHSARPSDPSPRLCSANKAGADNPEKALVPAESNPREGDAKTPHNSTLLCMSYGVRQSPGRQSWGVLAEHPATHAQQSRDRGRQRSVHQRAAARERMNERVPGSAAEKGLSPRPRPHS